MIRFVLFTVCFLLLIVCQAPAQSAEENQCLFSEVPENQNATEDMTIFQDTTLRVAILFVQFADWDTNLDARGSVGWSYWDPNDPQTYIIYNKFRYPHYWEMYFSRNTYYDPDPENPTIHPDWESHDIAVSGSFRDFWHEVTHAEFDPIPAVTHPAETDTMFRSGIINVFSKQLERFLIFS